jgi:hypothetical protein
VMDKHLSIIGGCGIARFQIKYWVTVYSMTF